MTSVTRRAVQTSPRKPKAAAPRASSTGKWASCCGVSLDDGPGGGRWRNAATPPVRPRLTHWLTAPSVTPSAAAMAHCFQPSCLRSQARSRRPSRQSPDPGRACCCIRAALHNPDQLYVFTRSSFKVMQAIAFHAPHHGYWMGIAVRTADRVLHGRRLLCRAPGFAVYSVITGVLTVTLVAFLYVTFAPTAARSALHI